MSGSHPPGGVRADARRSRENLLAAARAAFAEHGVGASFNEIARSAGVGPATLYRHFPRREDLIAAVVGESLDEVAALARRMLDDADPVAGVRRWMLALVSHVRRVRGLAAELGPAMADPDSALAPHCTVAVDVARDLVTRAAPRMRPGVTADDLIRLAVAVAWAAESDPDTDVERAVDLVLHGAVTPDP